MAQYERHPAGWPIYRPAMAPIHRRSATPPPAPNIGRPIRLPPSSADEEQRVPNYVVIPATFILQVPPITNIIYDLRLPPSTLRSALSPPFQPAAYNQPFSPSRPASIHLISEDFPWTIVIHESTRGVGVTCWDALYGLYGALQLPLADSDWGFASHKLRRKTLDAWKRRESLNGSSTCLKRVVLGRRCRLQGFRRNEDFVASRLLPGTRPAPDITWVVCFMR